MLQKVEKFVDNAKYILQYNLGGGLRGWELTAKLCTGVQSFKFAAHAHDDLHKRQKNYRERWMCGIFAICCILGILNQFLSHDQMWDQESSRPVWSQSCNRFDIILCCLQRFSYERYWYHRKHLACGPDVDKLSVIVPVRVLSVFVPMHLHMGVDFCY